MKGILLIAVWVMLGASAWSQGQLGYYSGAYVEGADSSSAIALGPAEAESSSGLGAFLFSNLFAPTRIGTLDGPLAGFGIWGQMLAGLTPDSLLPVGRSFEHLPDGWGLITDGLVEVPNTRPCDFAYVQMVAWDGERWGTSLAEVPSEWLGRTDVVSLKLGGGPIACEFQRPPFTQPAIVPIPEPSIVVFLALGSLLAWAPRFFRRAGPTRSLTGHRPEGALPDGTDMLTAELYPNN